MKRFGLILTTLVLFSLSIYLAFKQGGIATDLHQSAPESALSALQFSPVIYVGYKAAVAKAFAFVFNGIMSFMAGSVMLSIIALALLVELALLYPSIRIQLKQKKIHIFHKKLIDRFNNGELGVSDTQEELYKLYDVNEKMHHRGAVMVVIQILIFFFTFWGLNLLVKAPGMLHGTWSILNFSILNKPEGFLIPFVAGLTYLAHGIIKMYYKQKEDYISSAQLTVAFLFCIIGSSVVYMFAGIFAVALTLYFVTLITISTIRYIVVEHHSKNWGAQAQKELVTMLQEAVPHKDRFEYFSRIWNHLPIVRHINFNLLEEAISMTLGLLLALSFFGAFQKTDAQTYLNNIHPPAIAQADTDLLT